MNELVFLYKDVLFAGLLAMAFIGLVFSKK